MSDVDLMRRIEKMNVGDSTLFEDHVRELVKAARAKLDAEPYASGTPYDPRAEAATRALEAALKPFEGP